MKSMNGHGGWAEAQIWESGWWGDCANTIGEELKQLVYANRMGLRFHHDGRGPYNIEMNDVSVLDIGGGPVSLLLKCVNVIGMVADPLVMPKWVHRRYDCAGIAIEPVAGENLRESGWDEVWIYNVLQHTKSPARVIENARAAGKVVRIFEWIETAVNVGHPHAFTADQFDEWLGGHGKVETLKGEAGCFGKCYYGIFPSNGMKQCSNLT